MLAGDNTEAGDNTNEH